MAKAGRVYHWKHGWIPLDAYARSVLAKREGKKSFRLTDAPTVEEHKKTQMSKKDFEAFIEKSAREGAARRAAGRVENDGLAKKRTRKPANYVPPADNVPRWKPPSDAAKVAATKKALTKDQKIAELNKRRVARGEAPLPGSDAGQAAKAAARIKAVKEAGPPSKVTYVGGEDGNGGIYKIADSKGTVLYRTKDKGRATQYMVDHGDQKDWNLVLDQVITARVEASSRANARERYRSLTTVDGVDFVTYKSSQFDPLGNDHGEPWAFSREQMQTIADAYNEVKAEFPKLEPVQFVGTQGKRGVLGITSWDGRRVSILSNTFSDKDRADARRNFGDHGAIAGPFADDPEAFARAVVVHELGHALQMQKTSAKRRGEIIANEKVQVTADGIVPEGRSDRGSRRWQIDTLNDQTVYGLGNEYEWFAEAFAEGWFNGGHATPEGKRVLALLHDEYGKAPA